MNTIQAKEETVAGHRTTGIVTTRRDDTVAQIARQAPPLSEAQRSRLASLLKPKASAR